MNYFYIWLVGFILSYILIKIILRKGLETEWEDIIMTIAISLGSWLTVLCVIFTLLSNIKIKPPQWL